MLLIKFKLERYCSLNCDGLNVNLLTLYERVSMFLSTDCSGILSDFLKYILV